MSLNPEDRKSWHGFLDLLQPPTGYRLGAAVGTTFGLSLDALIAALLSMCDADGEEMAKNPVAAVMAITRLNSKVRVLVHPATTTGPTRNTGSDDFIALLDQLLIEVQPTNGLFHPKVWALRFEHIGTPKEGIPAEIGRVLVGSRNLTGSKSFELGAVFEGPSASEDVQPSEFGAGLARALREWLTSTNARYPDAVWRLPRFIGQIAFDLPREAIDSLRFLWQGEERKPLFDAWPDHLQRAVVVSPFIQPDFVMNILARTDTLHIVSIPESLDALPDATIAALDARAKSQGTPVLYQVTDHGNPDDAYIEGIHAKLVLVEDNRHRSTTLLGSANATGPGWGISGAPNVEAMIEMRPGVGIDPFLKAFVSESATKSHPWVSEYERSAKIEPDGEKEAERAVLAALREVAKMKLILRYERDRKRLTLSKASQRSAIPNWVSKLDFQFSLAPLLLAGEFGAWRPISHLETDTCRFEDVPIAHVTAFVVLRAQSRSPSIERQRFVLGRLEVTASVLNERDETIRAAILATADPAMVLNALVRGLAHVRSGDGGKKIGERRKTEGLRGLLADTTLERLLQVVALDPGLVGEMRLLLGPHYGEPLLKLCDDLEDVVRRVHAEAA